MDQRDLPWLRTLGKKKEMKPKTIKMTAMAAESDRCLKLLLELSSTRANQRDGYVVLSWQVIL